jgi:hypothetical protein
MKTAILFAALFLSFAFAGNAEAKRHKKSGKERPSPIGLVRHALCPFRPTAAGQLLSLALVEESSESELLGQLDLGQKYGPCSAVNEDQNGRFIFEYRDARVEGELRFDRQNRLEDFSFAEAQFLDDDLAKVEASVKALKDRVGLWVEHDGEKVLGVGEDKPLGVSRNFHLFVLKALDQAFREHDAKVTDVVKLEGKGRTVSFGLLHRWAPGTAITLDTLRNLVATENDATAVDMVIAAIGREKVEKQGASLAPLLTYREMARLADAIPVGTPPASRDAAMKLLASLPDADGIVDLPDERFDLNATVGWFASAKELCATARALRDDPAVTLAYHDLRDHESRKKGETVELYADARDPGVGQDTLLFRGTKGEYCVSFTLNTDGPVEDRQLSDVVGRVEALLLRNETTAKPAEPEKKN